MPYAAVTLGDLKVGMTQRWDSAVFWTDEEARLAINEALRDWNLLVGRWHRRLTLSTGAGTVEYALGATLIYGARVSMAAGAPLTAASILELDLGRPTWRSETTATGGGVPTVPTLWAPVSLQRIAIWPATAALGVNNLLIDGVANTPVLVEDGDLVDLGEELHDPLLDYALHLAAFKEGGPRWQATLPSFTAFLQLAAQENSLLKANRAFRRFAGLDRRRDLQPTKDVPTQLDGMGERLKEGTTLDQIKRVLRDQG
jgi:hypothetical protein